MRTQYTSLLWITLALPCAASEPVDAGLRQAFEQVAYKIEASGPNTLHSTNPAQRLTAEFDARSMRLQHAAAHAAVRLEAYGYANDLRTPAQAEPSCNGNRVEYRRGNLTEWYVNERSGLEQGFTLATRPAEAQDGEPLLIALNIEGGLSPVLSREGDAVLLQSEGRTLFRYGGLHAWDARGRTVASRLEVRKGQIRLIVEEGDAEYPLVVDPTWTQQQRLISLDGGTGFGLAVSVSGDTALVADDGQGRVYVFIRTEGAPSGPWTLQQELNGPAQGGLGMFGTAVSLSGDTAVVGAPAQGVIGSAAYVFVRNGTTWTQQQKLVPMDSEADDFGYQVSVRGDTAVIGAPLKDAKGAAYVFVRTGTTWTQQQEIIAPDGAPNDLFGYSVAVDRDTAVIGAWEKNGFRGAAYVFVRTAGSWTLQQEIMAADGLAGEEFGIYLAIDADTVLIGAWAKSTTYVFVRTGGIPSGAWALQQELLGGGPLAISGDTAVMGGRIVPGVDVYTRSGTVWTQTQNLTGFSDRAFSVSISGSTILVGVPTSANRNHVLGAAHVFVQAIPQAVSVTPSSGSGLSQTFGAVYNDSAGASDLQVVYLQIGGTGLGQPHTCFVAYAQGLNALYLFKDDNSGVLGPLTPGMAGTVSNSQCTLSGAGGAAMPSGNNLTVPFAITFNSGYFGSKNVYGLAQSFSGTQSASTLLGTWTPAEPPLTAVSVVPINGSGATPATFNALYTDTAGATDVQAVYLIFGSSPPPVPNGCFVAYVPLGNALYLFNDADTSVVAGSPITAGSSSTLSNSQCTLSGTGGTAVLSGNNFTAPFRIIFQNSFAGTHNVYGIVQSYDGTRSPVTLLGTWTLP